MSENTTPNLQPEVSLPIVPTIGDIDHFRIINKNGQSQKATITQVRELMGMDYSKLEEQIVHGEYWMDANGVKKQVYCRTWHGVTPAVWARYESSFYYYVLPGSSAELTAVWLVVGRLGNQAGGTDVMINAIPRANSSFGGIEISYSAWLGGISLMITDSENGKSIPYSVTLKYTK